MKLFIARSILALTAFVPSAAFAGASTSTGSATLVVVDQCSISGANVNLGTYLSSQTWGDVANATGWYTGRSSPFPGPLSRTLDMGSVTCDAGTPYTFTILGTGSATVAVPLGVIVPFGAAVVVIGPNLGIFEPIIDKVGSQVVADEAAFSGSGIGRRAARGIAGVGSGTTQRISGTMLNTLINPAALLAVPGVYTDNLTYQLDF